MTTIDSKFLSEFQSLSDDLKKKVLSYIQNLKNISSSENISAKNPKRKKIKSKPGFGGAKDLFKHIPANLDEISVSEDFEEYL